MAKMLGCLVASMTIGAALLDWFQPNRVDADTPRRQLIAQIRDAINPAAGNSTPAEKWHTIRAVPMATGDAIRAHFLVDRDGTWDATTQWQSQKNVGESGVIRIGLKTPSGSCEITGAQWSSTCQLRNNLQEMYKITRERFVPSPSLRLPTDAKDKIAAR